VAQDPLEVPSALGTPSEVWKGGERVALSER